MHLLSGSLLHGMYGKMGNRTDLINYTIKYNKVGTCSVYVVNKGVLGARS